MPQELNVANMWTEPTRTVGTVFPRSMVDAIEGLARAELISRSSWMRRVILAELSKRCLKMTQGSN